MKYAIARKPPRPWTHIGHEPVTHIAVMNNARLDGQVLVAIDPKRTGTAQFHTSDDHLEHVVAYDPRVGWMWC